MAETPSNHKVTHGTAADCALYGLMVLGALAAEAVPNLFETARSDPDPYFQSLATTTLMRIAFWTA